MISYEQLEYLSAFASCGTLSGVAAQFNISQPTITRCMKQLEEEFAVPLFERTKNSIKLNDNGAIAAEEAQALLHRCDAMLRRVRANERLKHTVAIGSAAAVQLPELIGSLASFYPDLSISTELKKPDELLSGLYNNTYQLIILPYKPQNTDLLYTKIGEERLMFYLPLKHRFSGRKFLSMAEMNGENMLLFSKIGFWHDIVSEKMPDSRFLVQNERYSLEELIANSVLPCFVTDLTVAVAPCAESRVCVPISDSEVNVTYYLLCRKENEKSFSALFTQGGDKAD